VFFAQAIEGRKQFLDVMRSKRCRLIVDDDRPIRVSRRHSHNLTSRDVASAAGAASAASAPGAAGAAGAASGSILQPWS
jgi:hypothetical protein